MSTLLVVDDSITERRRAGGLLAKRADFTVVYASDGRDALAQIELHIPDMILTDLQMPEMDGLELVKAVKKAYPLLPIVLMTAQGSEEIAVQALHAGASNYVPKRLLTQELMEIVERVLTASNRERGSARLLSRMSRYTMAFALENDLALLPAVVQHLQQTAVLLRLVSEADSLRVGVALEEALLNAYYHGNLEVSSELREKDHNAYYELARERSAHAPYASRRIHVEARYNPAETAFVIRDEGPGFDPSCLPDATDPANLEKPCGRGLLLMKTFMDDVSFNATGNEVTMTRRRRTPLAVFEEDA